jgi:orotate phosphoribosyltransferase
VETYQSDFIDLALEYGALKFGEFKLKSGRISPYFFNAGAFNDGTAFYKLTYFYSRAIHENFNQSFDVLFGPAYKGISLAVSASIGLKINYQQNIPVSFNRKEMKDHGEGGNIIGSSLTNKRILLVDDVITAGITIRDSFNAINLANGKLIGVILALDRQERGVNTNLSAIQEAEKTFNIQVHSIITLENLIEYLQNKSNEKYHLKKIKDYQAEYGMLATA